MSFKFLGLEKSSALEKFSALEKSFKLLASRATPKAKTDFGWNSDMRRTEAILMPAYAPDGAVDEIVVYSDVLRLEMKKLHVR